MIPPAAEPRRLFAVVPCAGRSRRMGQSKLLLPWTAHATVLEHVLGAWTASAVDRLVAVVRRDDEALADVCRRCGVEAVRPAIDPPDMKQSVLCGLAHFRVHCDPSEGDYWMVAPADMPGLTATAIDRVAACCLEGRPIVAAAHRRDGQLRNGHPVAFAWPLAAEARQLASHEGLNQLCQRRPVWQAELDEPGVLEDLDTPEDYRRLRGE